MNGLYSFLQKENTKKFATDLKQLSKLLRIYKKHHSDKRTKESKEVLNSVIKNFGEYLSPSCKKVLDTILGRNFEKICPLENSFIYGFRCNISSFWAMARGGRPIDIDLIDLIDSQKTRDFIGEYNRIVKNTTMRKKNDL